MSWLSLVTLVTILTTVGVTVCIRRGDTLGEPQTYVFETEDGDRANPFDELAEGATDASPTCRLCRRELPSEAHQYCTACFSAD